MVAPSFVWCMYATHAKENTQAHVTLKHFDNVSTDGSGEDEGHAEPDWSIEVTVRLDHFCKIVPQWYHPSQQLQCHLHNERLETLVGCWASQGEAYLGSCEVRRESHELVE